MKYEYGRENDKRCVAEGQASGVYSCANGRRAAALHQPQQGQHIQACRFGLC